MSPFWFDFYQISAAAVAGEENYSNDDGDDRK